MSAKEKSSRKFDNSFHVIPCKCFGASFSPYLSREKSNWNGVSCQRDAYWARFICPAIPEVMTVLHSGSWLFGHLRKCLLLMNQ